MQKSEVAVTSIAEAMFDQLSSEERKQVLDSVEEVSRTSNVKSLKKIHQSNGGKPFYILRVSPKIRVFLSHNDDDHQFVILDVLKRGLLSSERNHISSASPSTD